MSENFVLIPENVAPHNMQTFYGLVRTLEDFEKKMAEWQVQAIEAAARTWPLGCHLTSVSHSFHGDYLTAVFVFAKVAQ